MNIPLHDCRGSVRAYALIDGTDAAHVAAHSWHLGDGHPRTMIGGKQFLLSRFILGLPRGHRYAVRHLNGDPLDCRRANLHAPSRPLVIQDSSTTVRLPLFTRHRVAWFRIDRADLPTVAPLPWGLLSGYPACRAKEGADMIYLHRLLMGLRPGDPREVDHINRDRLDNTRANLRITTANQQNVAPRSTTGVRNVTRTRAGTYKVGIHAGGAHVHIGTFTTLAEADRAAKEARRRLLPFAVD